jgi:nicotinamide riboside transporter PnuC
MSQSFEEKRRLETFKSLIQLGPATVKTCFLLNGGGAIALLTFIGNLRGQGIILGAMEGPMKCFIFGLVCAALAFVFGYLTQFIQFNEPLSFRTGRHMYPLYVAIVLVVASIVLFGWGAYSATGGLT